MWHQSSGLAERETLHVLALPGPWQQDIRRQAPVFADPTIIQPGLVFIWARREHAPKEFPFKTVELVVAVALVWSSLGCWQSGCCSLDG